MSDDITWHSKDRDAMPGQFTDRAEKPKCAVCGALTGQGAVEVEIRDGADGGWTPKIYHLHLRCFSLLDPDQRSW